MTEESRRAGPQRASPGFLLLCLAFCERGSRAAGSPKLLRWGQLLSYGAAFVCFLSSACGDDGSPNQPVLPSVTGSYRVVSPRAGGTCADRLFLPVTVVIEQDGAQLELFQSFPFTFGPWDAVLEPSGRFTGSLRQREVPGNGLEFESFLEGQFSGSTLEATETLTIFDVAADAGVRDEVGLF